MTEIQFIVDRLNEEPFNYGLNMVSFKCGPRTQLSRAEPGIDQPGEKDAGKDGFEPRGTSVAANVAGRTTADARVHTRGDACAVLQCRVLPALTRGPNKP
jgi:hypothetical protein